MTNTRTLFEETQALAEKRRQEILHTPDKLSISGTTYYGSSTGSDSSDGLSPATAWQTLQQVTPTGAHRYGILLHSL